MKTVAKENLMQLRELLQAINKDKYKQKTDVLSGASVGQHIRHIIEFYLLLVSGSFSGTISYDKRQRDIRIEEDPRFAIQTIDRLRPGIDTLQEQLAVKFEGDFTTDGSGDNFIQSSIGRELAYCIENSIPHQAIVKAGSIELGLKSLIDANFGVAYSTIRYLEKKCVL